MTVSYFINYNVNTGINIATYRQPTGYANSDVGGLVDDILAGRDGCCPLEGAKDTLEDGYYWQGSDATPEILSEIHDAISAWEAENA